MENTETKIKNQLKIKINLKGMFTFPIAPQKHFRRLLLISTLLLVGDVGYHFYFFRQILSHDINQVTATEVTLPTVVNSKKLEGVLLRYEAKNKKRIDLQTTPTAVADPSK
jgi:hypothetical protein